MKRTSINGTPVVIWSGRLKGIDTDVARIEAGEGRQSDWLVPLHLAAIGPVVDGIAIIVTPAWVYDAAIIDEMTHLPAKGRA